MKRIYELLDDKSPLIMGIINISPDSFSEPGLGEDIAGVCAKCQELAAAGADIIDVGAESTRPGAQPLTAEEEKERLKNVLPALLAASPLPVSLDTYHAATARWGAELGVAMLNDVNGLQYAEEPGEMARVAAEYRLPIVVNHNASFHPAEGIEAFKKFWRRSLGIAKEAGIMRENIILDPGLGFAKDTAANLFILKHLAELKEVAGCEYPLLLGPSRKRFIGEILHIPPKERDEATGMVSALAVMAGCSILRVHNVKTVRPLCQLAAAIRDA